MSCSAIRQFSKMTKLGRARIWIILISIFFAPVLSIDVEGSYKQFVVLEELSIGKLRNVLNQFQQTASFFYDKCEVNVLNRVHKSLNRRKFYFCLHFTFSKFNLTILIIFGRSGNEAHVDKPHENIYLH